ncbi:MAG: acetamidase/formamidase family protein [Clostridia bacterium]|nr:acetamidase/formamidase family protein [Clostridia bacterium]
MQTAFRTETYDCHSPYNKPQIAVQPGEEFIAETELASGGWLHSLSDIWTPEKTSAHNPTVVIAVEGAKPGDLLAVDILDIVPDSLGYTGFIGSPTGLPERIFPAEYGLNSKTVRIADGFILWSDALKLPVRPMIGTLGTAPAEEALANIKGGPHGGNMDIQEVRSGTTVYLPVFVPGALLHVGDAHALQGDGEICGAGGIECRAAARLRARIVEKPKGMRCVRMEDETHIMAASCDRSVTESFEAAAGELLSWMVDGFGFAAKEAYLLMGQVMEARCTQFVNPTFSYICKMPKQALARKG